MSVGLITWGGFYMPGRRLKIWLPEDVYGSPPEKRRHGLTKT